MLLSNASIKEAVAFAQANNLESAEKSFKQAARLDPFYGEIRATLASIEKIQNNKEETIKYMEEAIKKSPYDFSLYSSLADIYLYYGDVEAAVEAGKKSAACAPWVISAYQSLTEAYVQGGIDCLSQGDIEGAKAYFKECSSLPEVLNDKAGNIPEKAKAIWDQKEAFFNFNSRINMNIGVSQLYLGQFPKAQEYLAKAYKDEEMKPEAGFWLAVLFQKTGMEDEAQNYLVDADQKLKARFQNLVDLSVISGGMEN